MYFFIHKYYIKIFKKFKSMEVLFNQKARKIIREKNGNWGHEMNSFEKQIIFSYNKLWILKDLKKIYHLCIQKFKNLFR